MKKAPSRRIAVLGCYQCAKHGVMAFAIGVVIFGIMGQHALADTDWLRPAAPWEEQANIPRPLATTAKQSDQDISDPAQETPSQDLTQGRSRINKADARQASVLRAPMPTKADVPSAMESMYGQRVVENLHQYGYDLFGVPQEQTLQAMQEAEDLHPVNGAERVPPPMGAVQDDFMLSSGDSVEIFFTGQRTDRNIYTIDSAGLIKVPDLPPVPAAGRSIGQVRVSLEAASAALHNTKPYISLASVRQIGVLVAGHVNRPGRQNMTVFHTVLDALIAAGGVQKTGSLRQIKLVRQGRAMMVDLYGLLLYGNGVMDAPLQDGDKIIVPAIGPTVAVAGEVKRPGVYEILPAMAGMLYDPQHKTEKLSLNDMLEFGGGLLSPGQTRFLRMAPDDKGQENVTEITDPFAPSFGDGAILMISKGQDKRRGSVELDGHTRKPGLYALADTPRLSALLRNDNILGPDVYPLIAVLERWDEKTLTRSLLDFSPQLVLSGDYDLALQDGDVLHIFSNGEIRRVADGTKVSTTAHKGDKSPNDTVSDSEEENGSRDQDKDPDPLDDPAIRSFLSERSAFIRGAVRAPGAYPLAQGVRLNALIAAAGGLSLEANTSNVEITSSAVNDNTQKQDNHTGMQRIAINFREESPTSVPIGPGDTVRINQRFQAIEDQSVSVIGQVRNPGRYDIQPGDTIGDLLTRAGGLTEEAYPIGAIFSRRSERLAEEARFRGQARAIKQAVAAALASDDKDANAGKISEARALADELDAAQGIGRITVEADPSVLAAKPELNMLLEPGDRLFIPKRNLTVRVAGEVLSPAALQFRDEKNPLDYIHEAGGFTFHADKDRSFVLYPDGSAQPLQVSSWNYKPVFIPPGSTVVVPRDPEPFDFIESAKDISQILSNLAVSAIFIDDVRNNN